MRLFFKQTKNIRKNEISRNISLTNEIYRYKSISVVIIMYRKD